MAIDKRKEGQGRMEQMFIHYEILEQEDKRPSPELVNTSVRLTPECLLKVKVLVSHFKENMPSHHMSQTSLMSQFVENCADDMLSHFGLWNAPNQQTIFGLSDESTSIIQERQEA